MKPDRELRDLARELAALRMRRATRYPAKPRARISAWMTAEGDVWWTEISKALAYSRTRGG